MTTVGFNFGVDFFNFLEENTEGTDFLKYNDDIVLYVKAGVALLAVSFIVSKS